MTNDAPENETDQTLQEFSNCWKRTNQGGFLTADHAGSQKAELDYNHSKMKRMMADSNLSIMQVIFKRVKFHHSWRGCSFDQSG
jgi:hypothetical protein